MLASGFHFISLLFWFMASPALASTPNFEILNAPQGPEKNYFVFLNLNTSRVEQLHYQAVAKEKGYGFLMIPNALTVKKMASPYEKFIDARCEDEKNAKTHRCKVLDQYLVDTADRYPVDLDRDLPAAFASIHGASVRALVISGHNSDNGMSGDYLSVDTYLHTRIIAQLSKQKFLDPGLFANILFLGLWGCDSVSEHTVDPYRKALPSLRLIAGYGDIAPSGIREESGKYLASLLRYQDALIAMGSKAQLKMEIDRLESVHQIFAALWVKTDSAGSFIYRHSTSSSGRVGRYEDDCDTFLQKRFRQEKVQVRGYYSGKLEIPEDNQSSLLRAIYYDFTSYSACYQHGEINSADETVFLSPARIGMLRFFNGIKANFVRVFPSRYDSLIEKSDRLGLVHVANHLKTGSWDDRRLSLLIERYLLKLDERCIDFLPWHAKRSSAPSHHCALNEQNQWVYP